MNRNKIIKINSQPKMTIFIIKKKLLTFLMKIRNNNKKLIKSYFRQKIISLVQISYLNIQTKKYNNNKIEKRKKKNIFFKNQKKIKSKKKIEKRKKKKSKKIY